MDGCAHLPYVGSRPVLGQNMVSECLKNCINLRGAFTCMNSGGTISGRPSGGNQFGVPHSCSHGCSYCLVSLHSPKWRVLVESYYAAYDVGFLDCTPKIAHHHTRKIRISPVRGEEHIACIQVNIDTVSLVAILTHKASDRDGI